MNSLDIFDPTINLSASLSLDEIESLFDHPEIKALHLSPSQKQHLLQMVLNNFDHRKAYEAFAGTKYDRDRSYALRSSRRFKMAVNLLQKIAAERLAKMSQWQLDASICDSKTQIARCDTNIMELEHRQSHANILLQVATNDLEAVERKLSIEMSGAAAKDVAPEVLVEARKKAVEVVVALETELREICAELRRWLKARQFWKENLDTVAGLRRDTGAAAQASASVVVDLSKASDDDIMKLAQAKLLRQNRRN